MSAIIRIKRGTAAAIASANPTPALGEAIFETDTLKLKIGDGTTAYNSLSYVADPERYIPTGGTTGQALVKASDTDYDLTWVTASGVGGVSDHGDLTGLADDDHTQYYNSSRLTTVLDDYTTQAEFVSASGVLQTQIDNHTHTVSEITDIAASYQPLAAVLTNTTASFTTAQETKLGYITVTQAVNLDTMESDIATNNAKVTNATHTGEVTGATTLTVDKTAITNKTLVSAAVGDHVLVADASDSDNLKRATIQTVLDLSASLSQTLTNKTIDANGTGNSISNLEVADFAGTSIVTESEGLASSDNDTSLPTTAAVLDYLADYATLAHVYTVSGVLQDAIDLKQDADANLDYISALSLTGNADKVVAVNGTEDGFELITVSGVSGGSGPDDDDLYSRIVFREDFYGTTTAQVHTWTQQTSTGSNATILSEIGRYGIMRQTTSTSTTGRASLYLSSNTYSFVLGTSGARIRWEAVVRISAAPTVGEDYEYVIGLNSSLGSGTHVHGVGFKIKRTVSASNWLAETNNQFNITETDTGVGVTGWHHLRMDINANATEVLFYIDGTLVATHTANIPTSTTPYSEGIVINQRIVKSAGTTPVTADIDFIGMVITR